MNAIDLFAGAGGFSTGAMLAGCRVLWAANHWPTAVEWHTANHPGTVHACQDLQQADFRDAPAHDILLASPACQGHSPARGKERPHHDARRATAWAVVTCAEVHRPPVVLVENVPSFADWLLWPAWCTAMHALGYALQPLVLDAADHGVPQHRRRLFVVATRSKYPVELKLPQRQHRPAAECIDLSAGSWSPINRPGRSTRTLARIEAGRRALLYSHAYPAGSLTIPADDEAGADALAKHDEAIHAIRTALAQQPAASGGPVAWHMRAIGCDGSADWCELGAAPPEPVHGVEVLPLVYAAAQPAPARVPLTDAQVLDLQSRYGWAKATIRAIEDLIFAAPCTANG